MRGLGLGCACITNHGDIGDYLELSKILEPGIELIPGVEISSPRGDFLIYSGDIDFLDSLEPSQPLPRRATLPEGDVAVVWAHPFAGIRGGLPPEDAHVRAVAADVDAIEVYNGNWPDPQASERCREIAAAHCLAEVAGSDTHRRDQLMRCWTELDAECGVEGLVNAIKAGRTRAAVPSPC